MTHLTDDQDALLDYLYQEGDPAERVKAARHLQECPACSVAVLELQTTRGMLSEWKPPVADLDFRIVRGQGAPPPQPAGRVLPSRFVHWAQAAAAVLLFVAGMAVSQLKIGYGDGTLTVGIRPSASTGSGAANVSIQAPPAPAAPAPSPPPAPVVDQAASVEQLLQRVRTMIDQSEARQRRELALRLSQVASEVDTQHKADLLRVQQNFGQLEMETGAQISQQQQLMDYLVRTSGGAK
jgi:hypothetical protein